jgi:hypothetical protein
MELPNSTALPAVGSTLDFYSGWFYASPIVLVQLMYDVRFGEDTVFPTKSLIINNDDVINLLCIHTGSHLLHCFSSPCLCLCQGSHTTRVVLDSPNFECEHRRGLSGDDHRIHIWYPRDSIHEIGR